MNCKRSLQPSSLPVGTVKSRPQKCTSSVAHKLSEEPEVWSAYEQTWVYCQKVLCQHVFLYLSFVQEVNGVQIQLFLQLELFKNFGGILRHRLRPLIEARTNVSNNAKTLSKSQ